MKLNEKFKCKYDSLNNHSIIAYAMGHFYNDLCASYWFTYLIFYLKEVLKLEFAPLCMLLGQITDAFCTPIFGVISD